MNRFPGSSGLVRATPLVLWVAALLAGSCGKSPDVVPVHVPPLSAVQLAPPDTATILIGASWQFSATALDTAGQPVSGVPFSWTTSDLSVARVTTSGRVTGVGEGRVRIVVAFGGRSDTAIVNVYPGNGWLTQTSGASQNLRGVFFLSSGRTGWAVGEGGTILKTSDAGMTWARMTSNTTFNLDAVWFYAAAADTLEGWAVGASGTLLHSLDAGVTWSRVDILSGVELTDIAFSSSSHGVIVGANGSIYSTFNGGDTWTKATPTLTVSTLRSVSLAGALDGWAVGDGGTILGTHDGGVSWYRYLPTPTAQALRSVWRRNATLALAVGDAGVTPRATATVDSLVWTLANAGTLFQLHGVAFPTSLVAYAVGVNGTGAILRSNDGGMSWSPQVTSAANALNDVWFVDADRGWVVGDAGTIRHTARGGQ